MVLSAGQVVAAMQPIGVILDAVVIAARALGHFGEPLDEQRDQILEAGLGLAQAVLQHALLVDHILEAALGVADALGGERLRDHVAQHIELSADPLILIDQLTDVVDEQAEQTSERGQYLGVALRRAARADTRTA